MNKDAYRFMSLLKDGEEKGLDMQRGFIKYLEPFTFCTIYYVVDLMLDG